MPSKGLRRAGQPVACFLRGLEFELPTADGGREPIGPRPPSRCRPRAVPSPASIRRRTSTALFVAQACQQLIDRTAHRLSIPSVALARADHGINLGDESPAYRARLRPARLLPFLPPSGSAGCGSPIGAVPGQLSSACPQPARPAAVPRASNAATARDYRRDAARHIYEINTPRIYGGQAAADALCGRHAAGRTSDADGKVVSMHWLRAPEHAPEVIAEIERTVLRGRALPGRHAPRAG